jgi:hypothetical protein
MKTRIELAMHRALEAHLVDGMPIETAATTYGVTESAIIHELEEMEYFRDEDYPEILAAVA